MSVGPGLPAVLTLHGCAGVGFESGQLTLIPLAFGTPYRDAIYSPTGQVLRDELLMPADGHRYGTGGEYLGDRARSPSALVHDGRLWGCSPAEHLSPSMP